MHFLDSTFVEVSKKNQKAKLTSHLHRISSPVQRVDIELRNQFFDLWSAAWHCKAKFKSRHCNLNCEGFVNGDGEGVKGEGGDPMVLNPRGAVVNPGADCVVEILSLNLKI